MAAEWWSIEVFNAEVPGRTASATVWRDIHRDALVESAITNGATEWEWHEFTWGVVFELCFADEEQWQAWRCLPVVQAALDAVPDPVNGFVAYRGRGGSAATRVPRRPRTPLGAATAELPIPADVVHEVVSSYDRSDPREHPTAPGVVPVG